MAYNLVCVHPFGDYTKGQLVTDQDEVKKLLVDREQNFVRVAREDKMDEKPAEPTEQESPKIGLRPRRNLA